MTRNFRYLFTLALSVTVLALASVWVPSLLTGGRSDLIYDTAEITHGPIRKVISTSGPVRALVTVSVGSQLSGQISELKADFNSEVKAGDELAVIDDKMFVARVAQASADLAAAKATLTNQQAALVKAEAIERNAKRLMERQQTLASKGIVATTTLDNATRDAEVAKADIEVARAQVENAKATIAQRESQLVQAQIDLDRTRIRSPIDGTVIARTVDVGQTVAASLQAPELFKIAQDLRRIRIEAQVNEADVGAIAEGYAVEFTVDAYPERRFLGRVAQVRLAATELNNIVTYTVIIGAINDDRRLFPGMTANVQVESAKKENALRIPRDALRFKPRPGAVPAAARNEAIRARVNEEIERMAIAIALTGDQVAKVRDAMKGAWAEQRPNWVGGSAVASGGAQPPPVGNTEDRMMQRLMEAVASVITHPQRSAFEAWKAKSGTGGYASPHNIVAWVLDASGVLEARRVRLGLVDDHFAELLGDELREGDKIVLRSREAGKK